MILATTSKPPFINKIHSQKNIQPLFANAIEKQKLHLLVSYFINCNTSYILNGLYSGSDLRRANYKAKFPLPLKLSSRCHRCTTCWKVFCILEIVINVKVSKFQNGFIKLLFLPNILTLTPHNGRWRWNLNQLSVNNYYQWP